MKRLYVRDAFRQRGIGLRLIDWLVAQARTIGYWAMYLDTMASMHGAIALYERTGFVRCEPYDTLPAPGAIHFRRLL